MLKSYDYEKTPVVEIVNDILVDCSKRGASDIHFDPHEDLMLVRIRIDGALINYTEVPNGIKKNLITRIKIIAGMNITESRLPQDGAIKTTLQGIEMDLRVSCLPTLEGEKIVIRILDYSMSEAGLESLGFSEDNYKKILKMINIPNGIILVTGATGTGKSTTVYSILQRLNKEETNIITVEDPIEMNIEGINQVQTNSEIGLTFANALRSILRQDPNIIMIGEIRDTETAKIAVRASITGHLVLSTIHTNNSLNTIERLLDMDVERYLLSSALTGIVSQKLARRLCPKCKKKRPTNEYEKNLFKEVLKKDIDEVYSAVGCDECGNGYKGRTSIHEVLLVNQEIKDAISSNIRKSKLRELVYKSNVTTLLQDGLEKVVNGQTTVEEILKIIELDTDDKVIEGSYSLQDALDLTSISQSANNNEKDNKDIIIANLNNSDNTLDNETKEKNNNNDENKSDESNSNFEEPKDEFEFKIDNDDEVKDDVTSDNNDKFEFESINNDKSDDKEKNNNDDENKIDESNSNTEEPKDEFEFKTDNDEKITDNVTNDNSSNDTKDKFEFETSDDEISNEEKLGFEVEDNTVKEEIKEEPKEEKKGFWKKKKKNKEEKPIFETTEDINKFLNSVTDNDDDIDIQF